jgi:hypothetical protein
VVNDTGNPNDGSFNGGNGEVVISYTLAAATTTTVPSTATTTPTTPTTPTAPASVALAVTGVDFAPLIIGGISLIAGGAFALGATAIGRRKKANTNI